MTTTEKTQKIEGIIKPGMYNFKNACNGKKARVAFIFETQGKRIAVKLFDNAANAFNRLLINAVDTGEKIWVEGNTSTQKWNGKRCDQFTGFAFGRVEVPCKNPKVKNIVLIY